MQSEIEATFIDQDHELIRQRLTATGAKLVYPERLMRRLIFDFPDGRLDQQAAWVRLRDEGDKITLTYKQRLDQTIAGMMEIETEVGNLKQTAELLKAIGLVEKSVQESKRELWQLDDAMVTLDTWPWIPPYVEVEGLSEGAVERACVKLEFDLKTALFDSTDAVYMRYFDTTRTEISSHQLIFGPIPDWLSSKRR